jgi:hypothetical protein
MRGEVLTKAPPAILLAAMLLSCHSPDAKPAATTIQSACPQLTSAIDPAAYTYSTDSAANAKLRSFVGAARGLVDASKKMEQMAIESCDAMAKAISHNASSAPLGPDVEAHCDPVSQELERLKLSNISLRVAFDMPTCNLDGAQRSACEGQCTTGDQGCMSGCLVRGEIYAACTLPKVRIELSQETEQARAIATALAVHLPRLFYAETVLGKRLINHVQTMARVGSELPSIKRPGLVGMTCTVASVAAAAEAGARIEATLRGMSSLTNRLVLGGAA